MSQAGSGYTYVLSDTSTKLTDQSEIVLHVASASATSLRISHLVIKHS
jgi:hypothetical protein